LVTTNRSCTWRQEQRDPRDLANGRAYEHGVAIHLTDAHATDAFNENTIDLMVEFQAQRRYRLKVDCVQVLRCSVESGAIAEYLAIRLGVPRAEAKENKEGYQGKGFH
jgi:hypothetical protein